MWFSDFQVVLEDRVLPRGSVRVEAGLIAEISETPVAGGIAGDGQVLLPGLIDMHGDMIEKEIEPRVGVEMPMGLAVRSLDRRLSAAGITTAYASVSFTAGASDGERRSFEHTSRIIRALDAERGGLGVDHKIHARFDITLDDAVHVIEGLIRDDTVDLVSLMDHTPGQGQYRDLERFTASLARLQGVEQDEAERLVAARIEAKRRPPEVLKATLDRVSALCHEAGLPLASHDDDTEAKVTLMQGLGCAIAEFPVTEEAARAAHGAGLAVAMGAPNALRGISTSGNLSARAAHAAGMLDILAADYHPGTIWPAIRVLAETDPDGLAGAVRMATATPARALGLQDRGRIAPGLRADLAIGRAHGVGHIAATLSAGSVIFTDGSLLASAGAAAA